ncbi:MAG: hypothetical protein Q7J98_10145 [Kiritimatiellia bacterium]|nr:hypothetical protein [Kiritimatiellia bacterium]
MNTKRSVIPAGLAVLFCAGMLAAAEVQITNFTTDKALYDFDEPVAFAVELTASEDTPADLLISVQRGVDAPRDVVSDKVKLVKGANSRIVAWVPGVTEYGHQAILRVRLPDGKESARAETLFEVCRDWPKITRWACAETCKDAAPDEIRRTIGKRALSVEQVMANMRTRYLNTYEMYAFPPHSYELDVKEDEWLPYSTKQAKRGLKTSAAQVCKIGQLLKKNGFKYIIYNETSSYYTDDPKYLIYRPTDGQLNIVYPMDRNEIDPNAFAIADLFGKQLAGSIQRFGWDGVFMDSCSQAMYSTYWCKDKDGNRLTDKLPGEVGRYYVSMARDYTVRANPRFKFISQNFNSSVIGRHHHSLLPIDQLEDTITRYYHELKWGRYVDMLDLLSIEYQMPEFMKKDNPLFANRFDKMMVCFNTLKSLSHKPQLAWFHINHPDTDPDTAAYLKPYRTVASAKPIMAAIFAARTSLADYGNNYGGHLTGPADDPVNAAFIDYHRFIMRYSQYLYDLELEWLRDPEKDFRVQSTRPLCWKYTTYRRVFADREEYVVNLLQLPEDGLIYAIRPNELPPVTDVELSWSPKLVLPFDKQNSNYLKPAKVNRVEAFVLSPDDKNQDPVELKLEKADDRLCVKVPSVGTWTMVVIKKYFPEYDRAKFMKPADKAK